MNTVRISGLDDAFDGRFSAEDWNHTPGGVHTLVPERDGLVGHVAVVQRRLLHRGQSIRAGYVEGLAVRHDAGAADSAAGHERGRAGDRHGIRSRRNLRRHDIEGFYQRRGWLTWRGPTPVVSRPVCARTEEYFFPSRAAAEQWSADRNDIEILGLDEGFATGRQLAAALLRYQS